jgi:acyl-CoA-binding protein
MAALRVAAYEGWAEIEGKSQARAFRDRLTLAKSGFRTPDLEEL